MLILYKHGELAQLEERHVDIVEVAGSSPVLPTIYAGLSCFFFTYFYAYNNSLQKQNPLCFIS